MPLAWLVACPVSVWRFTIPPLRPEEREQVWIVRIVAGLTPEARDIAALVDRHRCVPRHAAEVPDVGDVSAIPQHRVRRGEASDRLIADARDADDLSAIVDRRRRARRVTRNQRELDDAIGDRLPFNGAKLQDLRRHTCRIVHGVLGPADDLALVVDASRESVRTAERRQLAHDASEPHEADALKSGRGRGWEKR